MNTVNVSVAATNAGWLVQSDACEPVMFLSGGRAEAHARGLAAALARAGLAANLTVHDGKGREIARRAYAPSGLTSANVDTASASSVCRNGFVSRLRSSEMPSASA